MAPSPKRETRVERVYCERCDKTYRMRARVYSVQTTDRGHLGWELDDGNRCPQGHDTELRLVKA